MGKKATYIRKDALYEQAKIDGYVSRASYKLVELNKRYNLIKKGNTVIDLGSWPGGWIQVASKLVGPEGLVVGADLKELDPQGDDNIRTVVGDLSDAATLSKILALVPSKADAIISDMSPKLTGIKEADRAAASECGDVAFHVATKLLRQGGGFVAKLFKSNEAEQFVKNIKSSFNKVYRCELDSTRKSSNEFYVVGIEFKGK